MELQDIDFSDMLDTLSDLMTNTNEDWWNKSKSRRKTGVDKCAGYVTQRGQAYGKTNWGGNAWDYTDCVKDDYNGFIGLGRPVNGNYGQIYRQAAKNLLTKLGPNLSKLKSGLVYVGHVGIPDSSWNSTAWANGKAGKTASHVVFIYQNSNGEWMYDHDISYDRVNPKTGKMEKGAHGGRNLDAKAGNDDHQGHGAQVYTGPLMELLNGKHGGMHLVSIGYRDGGKLICKRLPKYF